VYNTAYLDGEDILVPVQTGQNPIYDDFGILVGYEPIYYYALCCEGICLEASSKVIVNPVIQEDENLLINGTFDRTGQGWNNKNGGHKFLEDNWSSICSSGNVSVGDHFKMTFTSADAIEKYLPTGGTPGVLTANMTDPTSTSAKVFGGNVLALCLNLDSSSAGITPAGFGDLLLANLVEGAVDVKLTLTADEAAALNGQTISQVLADAEHVLGGNGASSAYGLDTSKLNALTEILNESCISGDISPFAELHLRKP
jgi:hypothetical protein